MSVVIVLIAFSLIVAVIFLIAFIWAVKSGQYEDDYTPSVRILFEDSKPEDEEAEQKDTEEDQIKENNNQKLEDGNTKI
jgi:cbb3-type cytochrome oxidase maturation protein